MDYKKIALLNAIGCVAVYILGAGIILIIPALFAIIAGFKALKQKITKNQRIYVIVSIVVGFISILSVIALK